MQTGRTATQLAAPLPASAFHQARCLIPFITGYHLYTYRCWFGNALQIFYLFTFFKERDG
jgi:hypothetical protein